MEAVVKRAFRLHEHALTHLVESQGGGLETAVAELVMNAIDAGARNVAVSRQGSVLEVVDDGRGIELDEVESRFGEVGAPRESEGRPFGRYAMGRLQILKHGRCSWRTGSVRIDVDFEEDPGVYRVRSDLEDYDGCLVRCDTGFEDLEVCAGWLSVEFHYVRGCEIRVDGLAVNRPDPERCVYDDDLVELHMKPLGAFEPPVLRIYNQGVFVCTRPQSREVRWLRGDVSSKKPLALTLDRSAVQSDCPVWEEMLERLEPFQREWLAPGVNLSRAKRAYAWDCALSGTLDWCTLLQKLRVVEPVQRGAHLTVHDLAAGEGYHVVASDEVDDLVNWILAYTNIKVVRPFVPKGGFAALPAEYAAALTEKALMRGDLEALRPRSPELLTVKDQDLSKDELLVLGSIRSAARRVSVLQGIRFWAGWANSAEAWTDCEGNVWIHRDQLSLKYGLCSAMHLMLLVAHELSHREPSVETDHGHDEAFLQRFHRLLMGGELDSFSGLVMEAYAAKLEDSELAISGVVAPYRKAVAQAFRAPSTKAEAPPVRIGDFRCLGCGGPTQARRDGERSCLKCAMVFAPTQRAHATRAHLQARFESMMRSIARYPTFQERAKTHAGFWKLLLAELPPVLAGDCYDEPAALTESHMAELEGLYGRVRRSLRGTYVAGELTPVRRLLTSYRKMMMSGPEPLAWADATFWDVEVELSPERRMVMGRYTRFWDDLSR